MNQALSIWYFYTKHLLAFGGAIIFIVYGLSRKRSIFKKGFGPQNPAIKRSIDIVSKIIALICALVVIGRVIPLALDIPNAINGAYQIADVMVLENDLSNPEKRIQRDIKVQDEESGKAFIIHIYSKGLHSGEMLEVALLPFSMFGYIVSH